MLYAKLIFKKLICAWGHMECNLDGVIRSSDIKLNKVAETRINMERQNAEILMTLWVNANSVEKKIIEAAIANLGEKIIKIYSVNTRSLLR